ncbi:MAG: peptide ABC transporter permease, partial [Anaerolineae bacterium]|nr:peptide ABC transporter permease [Anaerolineae bacterium]
WLPVLLLIVAFITFALGYYGPGDPVQVLLGQHTNPAVVARIKHELGLDRPLFVQYVNYVWRALHGDFGESIVKYR